MDPGKPFRILLGVESDPHRPEAVLMVQSAVVADGRLFLLGPPSVLRVRVAPRDTDAALALKYELAPGRSIAESGQFLVVALHNQGDHPVGVDEVLFEWDNEPARTAGQPNLSVPTAAIASESIALEPADGQHLPLGPGGGREYCLSPAATHEVHRVAATLPVDRYRISIRYRGAEILRIPGSQVRRVLGGIFGG